ncbi:hypothetical protein B0T13DRAFT_507018 [Neurospora crassa]|nr:hypothetical protein B0T13DRAFT_507018 [Neurospora crassa]
MDHHENNFLPAEDLYDGAPADWVAYVQTLPPCHNCNERPVHLPGASRCLGCLGNRPGPQRREEMWRIIREGGHYCSSCYIREAPALGQSCPRCVDFRLAAKLLRKLSALLVPAARKLQMAHEATESARNADTPLAAVKHAIQALATVVNVCKSLDRAGDILRELTEVDGAKADTARPNYRSTLNRYREVAPLVQNVFVLAANGLGALHNENHGLVGALSNIDNFMPQIPPPQQGEIHNPQAAIAHGHHGDHQYHLEDLLGENNNLIPPGSPQPFQADVSHEHHHSDHEHQVENAAESNNKIPILPPQSPEQSQAAIINEFQGDHRHIVAGSLPEANNFIPPGSPVQSDGQERVHVIILWQSVPDPPTDNKQDEADLILYDFGPNFDPRVVPE